jgi:hypothetical protein
VDVDRIIQCDPAFADWLRQMTEPELDQRFSTAQAALDALR